MKLGRAPVLQLVVGNGTVHAQALRRREVLWAGEAAYESPDDLREVVARLAAAPSERCRRVHVTIERPPVQIRKLTDLPPVGEGELRALVANQAGRFFRRNGAALVTDAVWVTNGKGRVTHAAAVAEPIVLAVVAGAAEAGLIIESITPADVSRELQLLPNVERAVRARVRRRTIVRLAIAAGAAWLLAGVLFGVRLAIERREVDAQLAAADAPLIALRDVRREMRTAEAMVRDLAEARRSRGQALAALARVNGAIPDSAVLTSYTWRSDGTGVLAGAGRRAADVLAAVERSHAVPDPRIEGAIVREALGGHEWERFTIIFGRKNP